MLKTFRHGNAGYCANAIILLLILSFFLKLKTEKKLQFISKENYISQDDLGIPKEIPKIFLESNLKDGLYLDYRDFLNSKSLYPDFILEEKNNEFQIQNSKKEVISRKTNIWGIRKYNTFFLTQKKDLFSNYSLIPFFISGNTLEIFQKSSLPDLKKHNLEIDPIIYSPSSMNSIEGLSYLILSGLSSIYSQINQNKEINKYLINPGTGIPYKVEIYKYK